jgi:hypothetical protein
MITLAILALTNSMKPSEICTIGHTCVETLKMPMSLLVLTVNGTNHQQKNPLDPFTHFQYPKIVGAQLQLISLDPYLKTRDSTT